MLDLIIIGSAAAGSSAAIYAARRKLVFKVITLDVGGEVALCGTVNNWPGTLEIQGYELAQNLHAHAKSYDIDFAIGWKVTKIEHREKTHIIYCQSSDGQEAVHETKAVIIATGIHPRHLEVPREKELYQKGVTYCTVCDGPLFKNKVTATVGSGNAALESALMMSNIASKVYLISKYPNDPTQNGGFPKGEKILVDKVKEIDNIEIIYSAQTTEIVGENAVSALKYTDTTGTTQEIAVQGVMIHAGQIPNSQFIDTVEKTKTGEIIIDAKCRTNIPGILAAGDVTNIPYKQLGIASGQGIVAALSAIEYINRW